MITEVHRGGRFYRLSHGRAAHYENIQPHNPSTEDWCIPTDMKEGDYLMMDPACEVNDKGTREKNDENEVVKEGTSPPLDLDPNEEWVDDRSKPEVEFDDDYQQSHEQDLTNLRVLEWLNEMTSNPKETSVTIQDVDCGSMRYVKTERDYPSWAAQEGPLLIPASNLDLISDMRSTVTSVDIFVRGVGGRTYPH